jgi:hypothetical protein
MVNKPVVNGSIVNRPGQSTSSPNLTQSMAKETSVNIPRYLTPPVNIHKMANSFNSPAQAAAVKSLEKRQNIRNTVVYNRSSIPTVSRNNYDSDEYYSD